MKDKAREYMESKGDLIMKNQHVALCTANIGLYVPFDFVPIPDAAQKGLMEFKAKFIEKAKASYPEIDFSKKNLRTNLLLFVDVCSDSERRYEADFSVEMEAWYSEPENHNVICYDNTSEGFNLELSEEDEAKLKKIIIQELTDAFF